MKDGENMHLHAHSILFLTEFLTEQHKRNMVAIQAPRMLLMMRFSVIVTRNVGTIF